MSAVKGNVSVHLNGHRPVAEFNAIRSKFETLSGDKEARRGTVSSGSQYPFGSYTLGRKPGRSGSFSFQRSKDVPDIGVKATHPFFLREQDVRSSSRSLDLDYGLSTPPRSERRQKRAVTTPSLIPRPVEPKKLKEKLSRKPSPSFLNPAQSLTNLSMTRPISPARKSPVKGGGFSSSVYNLSIAPSTHNVSTVTLPNYNL